MTLVPPPSLETADALTATDRQALYIAALEAQVAAHQANQAAQQARAADDALRAMVGELAARYAATGFDPKSGKITRAPAPNGMDKTDG